VAKHTSGGHPREVGLANHPPAVAKGVFFEGKLVFGVILLVIQALSPTHATHAHNTS
jgi:hypothetical protein